MTRLDVYCSSEKEEVSNSLPVELFQQLRDVTRRHGVQRPAGNVL